jgi:hypothetical protein
MISMWRKKQNKIASTKLNNTRYRNQTTTLYNLVNKDFEKMGDIYD